ncbi:MAG: thiol:disulfide interchange protein DsbA/DsbL [Wenzhouxiangella sp.]
MITVILAALFLASPLAAEQFVEGTHFERIGSPSSAPDDRVEVTEAFAYPCPACRNFLPHITSWEKKQPDYVEFDRLPIALQQGWDLFARAYYTAEVMGLGEDAHEAVFKALHDERRNVRTFADIAGIYSQFDVTTESFINTSESFAVDSRMRRNRTETVRYGVRQTPTVIVQGKWRLSPGGFNSYDQMLEVVDYLVRREAAELGLDENSAADEIAASDDDGQ